MATIKHIASKNADYGAAEMYLLFQHDEFTNKPILDANGRLIPREDCRIAAMNCDGEDFAIACMRANLRFGKNQARGDIKSHHYIISFDPRDKDDHGLTMDQAQAMGEKYCAEHFPGHQALVCTHSNGHNHSGNIHVHIVINSLRVAEVERKPYMDRVSDTRAGDKHRCTAAALRYFRAEVMEMCQDAGLYQIDLLNGSQERVTEREYWAKKKGQAKLDAENAVLEAEGRPVKQTKYETDKEKLRTEIRAVLTAAASFDEFTALLARRGITVKVSRGRLSYLTPDRTKPITARKLGDAFDLAAVNAAVEQNATAPRWEQKKPSIREQLTQHQGLQKMVDIEAKRAEGKGVGYEKWAALYNLKAAAATINAFTEQGFSSEEELAEAVKTAQGEEHASRTALKDVEGRLAEKKELLAQLMAYRKEKPVRDGLKAQKSDKARAAYRQEHQGSFLISDAAVRYFKAHGLTKLPSIKEIQAEAEALTAEKNAAYNDYLEKKQRAKELTTIRQNLDQVLHKNPHKGQAR